MKNNWKKVKLSDVCDITSSKRIFMSEYTDKGIPFFRSKEIIEKAKGHKISTELFITNEKYNEIKNKFSVPQEKDLLLTSVGTLGIPYIVKPNEKFYFKDGNLTWFKNYKNVIPKFLYYFFVSSIGKNAISSIEIGSTQKAITIENLKNIEIFLPPLEAQQKIAKMLSAFDDKIELNNKMNENLEQQAQAIFKSWFIDFEPFGGKRPKDWKKGTFSELIDYAIGGDWGKEKLQDNYTEKVYCIRGADIPDVRNGNKGKMPFRYILPKNYENKKLSNGDLVVEISGGSPTQSTGRIAVITDYLLNRYDNKIVCTNFCRALKPKKDYSMFIYYYWLYMYSKDVFFSYENGTTGIKNFDITGFLETEKIVIPNEEVLKKFSNLCISFEKQIFSNGYENEQLANLRDTLLAKLMNGEIDVDKITI